MGDDLSRVNTFCSGEAFPSGQNSKNTLDGGEEARYAPQEPHPILGFGLNLLALPRLRLCPEDDLP